MRTRRTLMITALVAAASVLAPACTSEADPSTTASPFRFTEMPDGIRIVMLGRGESPQIWGQDCCGTESPMTVLVPADVDLPRYADAIVVAAVGFAGQEGGLDQSRLDRPGRVELLDRRGDDLAVRIDAPGDVSNELLASLARATTATGDHDRPPKVEAPTGWRVLGSTTGRFASAVDAVFGDRTAAGPSGTHSATFSTVGRRGTVGVLTLPGIAADAPAVPIALEAILRHPRARLEASDDRTVFRSICTDDCASVTWLVRATRWGDLLFVHGSRAGAAPALVRRMADAVEPTDERGWRAFRTASFGSDRPEVSPNRTELLSGTHDGLRWLIQTFGDPSKPDPDDNPNAPETCLRIASGQRLCGDGGMSITGGRAWRYDGQVTIDDRTWQVSYVAIDVSSDVAAARVRTSLTAAVELRVVRNAADPTRSVGIAFDPGVAPSDQLFDTCPLPGRSDVSDTLPRLELLRADGTPLPCPGA